MTQYHISSKGQQLGPFPESEVISMLSAGTIVWTDLCWTEGMKDWKQIQEIITRPAHIPPPSPSSAPPPLPTTPLLARKDSLAANPINWIPALILYCFGSISSLLISHSSIYNQESNWDDGMISFYLLPCVMIAFWILIYQICAGIQSRSHIFNLVSSSLLIIFVATKFFFKKSYSNPLPYDVLGFDKPRSNDHDSLSIEFINSALELSLYAIVLASMCILHYRCWRALPERFRATTPGKAVGFLFIPFYNIYWAFVTWPRLADGITEWRKSLGKSTTSDQRSFAIAYAVCFVSIYLLIFFPDNRGIEILHTIIDLVFFVMFYRSIVLVIKDNMK